MFDDVENNHHTANLSSMQTYLATMRGKILEG